jgi:thioredoxin-related protein
VKVTRIAEARRVAPRPAIWRHFYSSPFFITFFHHSLRLLLVAIASITCATAADSSGQFFSLNMGDLKAELAEARAEGKRAILLFFEQEGCPGCRHMKQNIFNQTNVQAYYGQNFVSLPIDIHSSVPLKDFAGKDLTEKTYAQSLKIRATPTFVFYDLAGGEIVRIVGPTQTPQEFLLLGQFVTSGAYKKATFAQYKAAGQR